MRIRSPSYQLVLLGLYSALLAGVAATGAASVWLAKNPVQQSPLRGI